jgi:ABC-type phosphate transport system substrate-binding protein
MRSYRKVLSAVVFLALGVALLGPGATGASATTCPNSLTFVGIGPAAQNVAQETWTAGYAAACLNSPEPEYSPVASGPAGPELEAFRFIGSGSIDHEAQFVGSDAPPSAAQITNAEAVSGGAKPVIVPVAQTAIVVVIHPPANCKFPANKGITWTELNKVFGGSGITSWNQFSNIEATVTGACNHEITRVVRGDASGTTKEFKKYLSVLETSKGAAGLPCATGTGSATRWAELTNWSSASGEPNIVWPQCTASTPIVARGGGRALARCVANNANTIGYADLPDAKGASDGIVVLQNGEVAGTPIYAHPDNTTTSTARCESARYTVPVEGREGHSGKSVDWSGVSGAAPSVGGTEYPLCTLTYDLGWDNYADAGYGTNATGWGLDVAAYVKYEVTPSEGQSAIAGKWYSTLPVGGGGGSPTGVQSAAEFAASKLP